MGQERKVYKLFVGKARSKEKLGRLRRRWENGIKMDLMEIGWGIKWIQLAQYRGRCRLL
jgi:hypothetical protein